MLLSGVGDAIGFKWEFDFSGEAIHQVGVKMKMINGDSF